jgi:DNA repair photolyase
VKISYEPKGRAGEYSPLAANLYKGCEHGCKYCYVPAMVRREKTDFHAGVSVRSDALKNLEADLKIMQERKDTRPVFLSFTTDPYQPIEETEKLTRRAILLMHSYGIPVMILTKGTLLAERDFDLLGVNDWFGTTLTCRTGLDSLRWEPQAVAPGFRIESLMKAHDKGIKTWASIEPVINPDDSLDLIRTSAPFVDMFKVGKLNHMPEIEARIDWRKFGRQAESLVKSFGKEYYVKSDLREQMR